MIGYDDSQLVSTVYNLKENRPQQQDKPGKVGKPERPKAEPTEAAEELMSREQQQNILESTPEEQSLDLDNQHLFLNQQLLKEQSKPSSQPISSANQARAQGCHADQKQTAQKQDAQKQTAQKQTAQKQTTQKQATQKQDAQKQDAQKPGTAE